MNSEQDELTEQGKLILEFERICPFLEFSIYERIANFILADRKRIVNRCSCVYESDCHGIEMIKSPSGKEWSIGGTETKDRWKFCPWCGGVL